MCAIPPVAPLETASRRFARIPELDGIRGVAILLVIVWHYVHLHAQPVAGTWWAKVNTTLRMTWSGVDLFFVLSGFLIGGILLSQRKSPDYYRVFYSRRILRIFPLYCLFLGFCAVMQTSFARELFQGVAWMFVHHVPFLSYLTFTQNLAMSALLSFGDPTLNITWSLAIEEQFYLLLPVLIRTVSVRRLPIVLLSLIGLGIALRWFLYLSWPRSAGLWCYILLPCRWDPLFLGVLGAWALRQPHWASRVAQAGRWMWTVFILLGMAMAAGSVTAKGVIMAPTATLGGCTVLGVFYFSGVMLVVSGSAPRFFWFLQQRWIVHVGVVSYGIYLLHETVAGIVHHLIRGASPEFRTPTGMLVTGLAFALTLALATLSWRWFEKPFVEWSHRRFKYRPSNPPPATAG